MIKGICERIRDMTPAQKRNAAKVGIIAPLAVTYVTTAIPAVVLIGLGCGTYRLIRRMAE